MTVNEKISDFFKKTDNEPYWKNLKYSHPRYYISDTRDSDNVIEYVISQMKKDWPEDINWNSESVMKQISHLIEVKLSSL